GREPGSPKPGGLSRAKIVSCCRAVARDRCNRGGPSRASSYACCAPPHMYGFRFRRPTVGGSRVLARAVTVGVDAGEFSAHRTSKVKPLNANGSRIAVPSFYLRISSPATERWFV